jgi:hypothetical protein
LQSPSSLQYHGKDGYYSARCALRHGSHAPPPLAPATRARTQALSGRLSRRAIALSAYLSEVSLLDHLLAATPPSLVAAAALAVAAAWHGGGGGGDVVAALRAATGEGRRRELCRFA